MPATYSALRLEIAAIDAELDQVRAALRKRDAELAGFRAQVHTCHEETVAQALDILILDAANQRDTKRYRALVAERRDALAAFARRLDRMADATGFARI
jgi:hypothetical protein